MESTDSDKWRQTAHRRPVFEPAYGRLLLDASKRGQP